MSVAIRHVWIIQLPITGVKKATILFSRKFPSVEKRSKLTHGEAYIPVPQASDMLQLLVQEISQTYNATQFIPSRDRCDLPIQKPVHRIFTDGGVLWPVVAIEKNGLLLCCMPLVEGTDHITDNASIPVINIPSIPLGVSLLETLAEYLKVSKLEMPNRLLELPSFINEVAPFGLVRDGSVDNLCARLANKPCMVTKSHKVAAWRSAGYKGKSSLQVCVTEYINASQCAQETWQDISQVYGEVTCKAEFEGAGVNITLNIANQGDGLSIPLDMLTVHPCMERADWQDHDLANATSHSASRRVRFSPPLEHFTLCTYTVKRLLELPIFGVYHLKLDDTKASITVQLKLNDQIKNNFEVCELHIPFYTRDKISNVDGTPTQGSVSLSSSKKVLIWNIGQKFTSKDQQASLAATVTFASADQGLPAPSVEDAFCRGNNSYAQLNFKIQDFTMSGCWIDPKSIQVSPSTKFKLQLNREYLSVDYKIWNSGGEALTTQAVHEV
ncbi:unnamed protein product [Candidula unifasciata]|uniref:AP-5 complex subunit mu-1 n=1 Tax=Candidula unifasciata TaxID=100452 RepID=A0A8S4A2G7_9EUPU|nr:unnamed protein product [Candidula unifasciata]